MYHAMFFRSSAKYAAGREQASRR